jgi:hypothetical protein
VRESFSVSPRRGPDSRCGRRGAPGRLDPPSRRSHQKKKDTGVFVNLISFAPTTITTLFALAAGLLLGYLR